MARLQRVTVGGDHHPECRAPVPLQLDLVEPAVRSGLGGCQQHLQQVRLEPHQNRLRLGVAQPAIELQRLGLAGCINHQAGVQKAGVGNAVFFHATHSRQDDFAHGTGVHIGRDHRRRRIGAHAAGVGASIAVQQALVVLAGRQRQHVLTVAQHDETGLFALQKLFNDDSCPTGVVRHAQAVAFEHEVHRLMRLRQGFGHHHALASGQTVGLDHDRGALLLDVGMGRHRVGESLVGRGRDAMALHEGLGKGLGALQLRCRSGRAEDAQTMGPKLIHHAGRQRAFGADHGQANFFVGSPGPQGLDVGDGHIFQVRVERRAAIAGRDIDLLHPGRLRQLPGQRMFAAAAANHQDIHASTPSIWAL